MTKQQAALLWADLLRTYPRTEVPTPTQTKYLEVLIALPFERTRAALEELALTSTFLPSIAEIVTACGVTGDDVKKLARAIREKQPLSRDYVHGWVVGPTLNPFPAPEKPALPEPATVDIRKQLREFAGRLTGRTQ